MQGVQQLDVESAYFKRFQNFNVSFSVIVFAVFLRNRIRVITCKIVFCKTDIFYIFNYWFICILTPLV